jgi:DNA-3-methyladenine glycosylase
MEALPRSFYDRNAVKVAPALLGCVLARRLPQGLILGRIVETEAYVGEHDLACHARAGRTRRTEVMYGEPGRAYVYLIYGIHQMLNCVCGPGSAANAVLLRAVEPLPPASSRHTSAAGVTAAASLPWLHVNGRGPGNLCKAFGVERRHNAQDLCDASSELFIGPRQGTRPRIVRGPRIGVAYAGVWADEPLRFCDAKSAHLSRPNQA